MISSDIPPQRFRQLFAGKTHVYNTVEFTELNREKADGVSYLAFEDTKVRGGLILGRRGNLFCSPFSSPYGGLVTGRCQGIAAIERIWRLAVDYGAANGCGLRVTLPPVFMDSDLSAKSVNVLTRLGGVPTVEINHHFDLTVPDIHAAFDVKTRNQLHQAQKLPYMFGELAPEPDNIARVYDVIVRNHTSRGYPVNMTLDDVTATAPVVCARFFILTLEGVDVAAAQVHNPAPGVAQVIYWGDVPGHSSSRPMNMLAYRLFELYKNENYRIMDIGISTVDGVPNYGLCDFKEGLGCRPTAKFTFLFPCESRRPRT